MTNPTPHGQVPEALRLALSIDLMDTFTDYQQEELNKAAAELRRLHAENERLSGLCDKWNSECDEFREDNKRLAALVEAQQHTRIAELEAELEAVGAGGGQALSAAPADQSELHAEALRLSEILIAMGQGSSPEPEELWADGYEPSDGDVYVHRAALVLAMLTASPTPPAEQQTTPKAAPVVWLSSKQLRGVTALHGQYLPFRRQPEGRFDTPVYLVEAAPKAAPSGPDYSEKWDAELGRTAMRFVDRAGDVHPGIDDAETICAEFHNAMSEVIAQMPRVQRMAAPQQEAQEPVALLVRKNSWRAGQWEAAPPDSPSYGLAWANQRQYVYAAPQPAPAPLSERDAFEAAWEKLHGKRPVLWSRMFAEHKMETPSHSEGKYFARDEQAAWKLWQARAALAAQGGK